MATKLDKFCRTGFNTATHAWNHTWFRNEICNIEESYFKGNDSLSQKYTLLGEKWSFQDKLYRAWKMTECWKRALSSVVLHFFVIPVLSKLFECNATLQIYHTRIFLMSQMMLDRQWDCTARPAVVRGFFSCSLCGLNSAFIQAWRGFHVQNSSEIHKLPNMSCTALLMSPKVHACRILSCRTRIPFLSHVASN